MLSYGQVYEWFPSRTTKIMVIGAWPGSDQVLAVLVLAGTPRVGEIASELASNLMGPNSRWQPRTQ